MDRSLENADPWMQKLDWNLGKVPSEQKRLGNDNIQITAMTGEVTCLLFRCISGASINRQLESIRAGGRVVRSCMGDARPHELHAKSVKKTKGQRRGSKQKVSAPQLYFSDHLAFRFDDADRTKICYIRSAAPSKYEIHREGGTNIRTERSLHATIPRLVSKISIINQRGDFLSHYKWRPDRSTWPRFSDNSTGYQMGEKTEKRNQKGKVKGKVWEGSEVSNGL
ncbi:hypothetical protein C8R44DRAFT_750422 [Mycena epipterygia]|nr:hypothetical protein C8R44DRAFT_750422 [Mycena epipterygia]